MRHRTGTSTRPEAFPLPLDRLPRVLRPSKPSRTMHSWASRLGQSLNVREVTNFLAPFDVCPCFLSLPKNVGVSFPGRNSAVVPKNQNNKQTNPGSRFSHPAPLEHVTTEGTERTHLPNRGCCCRCLKHPHFTLQHHVPSSLFAADAASKSDWSSSTSAAAGAAGACCVFTWMPPPNRFACNNPYSTKQSFSSPGAASLIINLETEEPRIPGAASLTSPGATPAAREAAALVVGSPTKHSSKNQPPVAVRPENHSSQFRRQKPS